MDPSNIEFELNWLSVWLATNGRKKGSEYVQADDYRPIDEKIVARMLGRDRK